MELQERLERFAGFDQQRPVVVCEPKRPPVEEAIEDIRNGQWRATFILRFREALCHLRLLAW